MFADSVLVACAASAHPDWRRPTHSLPVSRRREAAVAYACSAWSGFITASDRHRVDAFLRRSNCSGCCQPDLLSFDELLEDADDTLFNKLCNNPQHSLHYLLPPPNLASQHMRPTSSHNRQLPTRSGHLADANFITRLLYKDCYWSLTQ